MDVPADELASANGTSWSIYADNSTPASRWPHLKLVAGPPVFACLGSAGWSELPRG
jgi:hypothetical protein